MGTGRHAWDTDSTQEPHPGPWRAREITSDDAELLFSWRNDSGDLQGLRTGSPVSWADHLRWIESSIERSDRIVLVVSDELGDIGTVRWDERTAGHWELSITVAPERRGRSLARRLLAVGEQFLSHDREVISYLAVVHRDNVRSLRMLEGSHYLPGPPADKAGFLLLRKTVPDAGSAAVQ